MFGQSKIELKAKQIMFPRPGKKKDFALDSIVHFNRIDDEIPYFQRSRINEKTNDLLVKIFYSHGNGEDLDLCTTYLEHLLNELLVKNTKFEGRNIGFSIRAWEYPSYGESLKPFSELTEKSIKQDARKAYEHFEEYRFVDKEIEEITIAVGFSLGCFPTLYLTSKYQSINACIALAPFANIEGAAAGALGSLKSLVSYYLPFKCPNDSLSQVIKQRIIVVQSEDDDVIPFAYNSKQFSHLGDDHRIVEDKNHTWFIKDEGLEVLHRLIFEITTTILETKKNGN